MNNQLTDVVLQAISRSKHLGFFVAKESGELTFVNEISRAVARTTSAPEHVSDLFPESLQAEVMAALTTEGTRQLTFDASAGSFECIIAVSAVESESHRTVIGILVERDTPSRSLKAIGQVTGKFGHDFNNLLGSIRGSADLLEHKLKKELGDELPVTRQLRLINASINKAVKLTDTMRGYARIESAHMVELSLGSVLESIVQLLLESGVAATDIVLELQSDLPVLGNAFQLSHAFQSIILNALDAMRKVEERSLVLLLTEHHQVDTIPDLVQGTYMQFSCIDHGTGMDREKVEKAFEPFFSTKSSVIGSGLGLGLPMAREIVLEHGGSVLVNSIPNSGTIVRVLIPVIAAKGRA